MPGIPWSTDEEVALRERLIAAFGDVRLVVVPGRTNNAIRTKALRLHLISPARQKTSWWTARQIKLLKQLRRAGSTPELIFNFDALGEPLRTLYAIRDMWKRLKLADRRRSRAASQRKIWRAGERERFDAYVLATSERYTPEQIGVRWQCSTETVRARQRLLGVKLTIDRVRALPYSREKRQRCARRTARGSRKRWKLWRIKELSRLQKDAAELRLAYPKRPERICRDCHMSWPLRREFFHAQQRRSGSLTTIYFKYRCRLCENSRRRGALGRKPSIH